VSSRSGRTTKYEAVSWLPGFISFQVWAVLKIRSGISVWFILWAYNCCNPRGPAFWIRSRASVRHPDDQKHWTNEYENFQLIVMLLKISWLFSNSPVPRFCLHEMISVLSCKPLTHWKNCYGDRWSIKSVNTFYWPVAGGKWLLRSRPAQGSEADFRAVMPKMDICRYVTWVFLLKSWRPWANGSLWPLSNRKMFGTEEDMCMVGAWPSKWRRLIALQPFWMIMETK